MKTMTKDKVSSWIFFIIVLVCFMLLSKVCEPRGSSYAPDDYESEEDIHNPKEDDYWRLP